PALPGARRDLAPDELRVAVVDDEPVGVAEVARALLLAAVRRVELRRVRDAVVASLRRARGLLGGLARFGDGERGALGALDVAVDGAGGDAAAGVVGDPALGVGDEVGAERHRVG